MKLSSLSHPWAEVQSAQTRLKMRPNSRFLFMHNPKNWELHVTGKGKTQKGILLPSFSVLRLTAGVNLVRANGKKPNPSIAIANMQEKGFTILDPEKHDYLRVYPCTKGQRYEDKFTHFEQVGTSIIRSYDHESYNEFRRMLMLEGHIDLPHEHFITVMILDNQKLIDKYAQLQHNPNHEALYKRAVEKDKFLKQAKQAIKKHGREAYERREES